MICLRRQPDKSRVIALREGAWQAGNKDKAPYKFTRLIELAGSAARIHLAIGISPPRDQRIVGPMTDRLSLTNALADANIDRQKAERIATEIFDAIHDNVATKQDLQMLETRLRAELDLVRHQLLTRLGGLIVVVAGALFAALRMWPPAAH